MNTIREFEVTERFESGGPARFDINAPTYKLGASGWFACEAPTGCASMLVHTGRGMIGGAPVDFFEAIEPGRFDVAYAQPR